MALQLRPANLYSPNGAQGADGGSLVDLALKTLLHDKVRFAITVSGVAFAVTLVFVQVGLFFGLLSSASATVDHMDADLWVTSRNTANVDFAQTFTETKLNRIRSIAGVERADNLILSFMTMQLPTGTVETVLVYAMEDLGEWRIPWKIEEGRIEDLRRGPFIFLDDSAERRFGAFAVGEYREIMGKRVQIIGRTSEAKSFTTTPIVFMSTKLAQQIQPEYLGGKTAYTVVRLKPGADAEAVAAEIGRRLPYNDVHTREAWSQISRSYWVKNTGLGLNMYTTVFLGCLVGIVIVAQTLYTSTMEHIREFGTVKAIGGSNWDIYKIIGRQAVIAAALGAAFGYLPTFAVRPLMRQIGLELIIPTPMIGAVFVGSIVLCLLASFVSFRKVASIDPALVFRQ